MARLVYCALEPAAVELPAGIAGAKIEVAQVGALQVLYSEADPARLAGGHAREHALHFHAVLSAVFAGHAILSFRFPTCFATEQEMIAEIGPKAAAMAGFLRANSDAVQMEVRLSVDEPASGAASGTAYLQQRRHATQQLESAADACRKVLGDRLREWRQRAGSQGLRCYALLARDAVPAYREAMSALALPAGVRALVSGPWPANEFLEFPNE